MDTNNSNSTAGSGSNGDTSSAVVVVSIEENVTHHDDKKPSANDGDAGADGDVTRRDGGGCCGWTKYDGIPEAQGYSLLGLCRAPVYTSNLFMATSLLYFASKEAGCLVPPEGNNNQTDYDSSDLEVDEDCTERVYGFAPAALITNIAVISGLLSAFFMPLIGAILDFTTHRWIVGWGSAVLIAVIQFVQVGVNENTWFIMSILQSVVAFFFRVQVLVTYAYLPDIARVVDETTMVRFSGSFTGVYYSAQLLFLVTIVGISAVRDLPSLLATRISQIASGLIIAVLGSAYAWPRFFTKDTEPLNPLPEGRSIVWAGFVQNYKTVKDMYKNHRKSLFWFNVSIMFGEAGILAILPVSVTLSTEILKMNPNEVGLVFILALLGTMPGTWLQRMVYRLTDPKVSWMGNFFMTALVSATAGFVLTGEDRKFFGFVWGGLWGFCFGWYFPTKIMVFSEILPKGQDSEYSGFLVYVSQILVWLPPLLFSLSVEAGMDERWGIISMGLFSFLGGLATLQMHSWSDLVKSTGRDVPTHEKDENTETKKKDIDKTEPPDASELRV